MMRVLDLFSGVGCFSLGLERTGGYKTVAFCEIADFQRSILSKHWPEVPIYHDIRKLTAADLERDGIAIDVICGGFPCQDVSIAGRGKGIDGSRTGLWRDVIRLAEELSPRFIILENVSKIRSRGLEHLLSAFDEIGYDAEWHCIPAAGRTGLTRRKSRKNWKPAKKKAHSGAILFSWYNGSAAWRFYDSVKRPVFSFMVKWVSENSLYLLNLFLKNQKLWNKKSLFGNRQ